jgi:serine/threonine-protein kinase
MLRKAIALDPNYADAYSEYAGVEGVVGEWLRDKAQLERAQTMATRAVALAPDRANGYAARGFVRLRIWDWAGAQADYDKALAIDPDHAGALWGYAFLMGSLGRLPEAISAARKAIELDPLSSGWGLLEYYLTCNGDYVGAEKAMHRALEISPDRPGNSGWLLLVEGKSSEALSMFRKDDSERDRLMGSAMAEYSLGNVIESQQALDELIAKYAYSPWAIAQVYAWRGEKDKAFEWLDRAYEQHDPTLKDIKANPALTSLRSDPRYKALLKKMILPE